MKLSQILETEFDDEPSNTHQSELLRLIKKLLSKEYEIDKMDGFIWKLPVSKRDKVTLRQSREADAAIEVIKQILFLRQDLANKTTNLPSYGRVWAAQYVYFKAIANPNSNMHPYRIQGFDKNGRAFNLAAVSSNELAHHLAYQWNIGNYNNPPTDSLLL